MNKYLKKLAAISRIKNDLSNCVVLNTFAISVILSNGVPAETISKMFGHASLKITQIYARIVDLTISKDMEVLKLLQ